MTKSIAYAPALALLLCDLLVAQGPSRWVGVTNPHFEIYSQAGGDAPRQALVWFEGLREVFLQGGLLPEIARPASLPVVCVIGFRSAQDYAAFQLRSAADAYYTRTRQRDYIVMPSFEPRDFALAAHEYAHFALRVSGLKIPNWLAEGLAEYFSTLRFTESGYELGGSLPARSQTLGKAGWIPLAEFFDFRTDSTPRPARHDIERFYAQSWALADMLMSAPGYRSHLSDFITGLNSGMTSSQAFAEVYGKSLDAVSRDLTSWFSHKKEVLRVPMRLGAPATASSFVLSDDQTASLLADLLVAIGKLDRARVQYAELLGRTPHDPDVHAALADIAFSKGEREEALREWRQALDDGLKDADLCFRYAVAAEEAGAPDSEIKAALVRAVALRPAFDDARFKLALLESNAGNYRAAVDQLRAMSIPEGPRAYGYWAALAYAFTELDQRGEALAAARKALSEAKTDEDRAHARRLAYVATTDLRVQVAHDAEGRLQMTTTRVEHGDAAAWNPFVEPADKMRHSKGQLREVLCVDGKLTGFRVVTPEGPLILDVPDPLHVLIENGPDEVSCGAVEGDEVGVDYAVVDAGSRKQNILRGIQFDGVLKK